jgi:hypothetical protein
MDLLNSPAVYICYHTYDAGFDVLILGLEMFCLLSSVLYGPMCPGPLVGVAGGGAGWQGGLGERIGVGRAGYPGRS